jgi:hypothetical protein
MTTDPLTTVELQRLISYDPVRLGRVRPGASTLDLSVAVWKQNTTAGICGG